MEHQLTRFEATKLAYDKKGTKIQIEGWEPDHYVVVEMWKGSWVYWEYDGEQCDLLWNRKELNQGKWKVLE